MTSRAIVAEGVALEDVRRIRDEIRARVEHFIAAENLG
jgi:hypothetical protein